MNPRLMTSLVLAAAVGLSVMQNDAIAQSSDVVKICKSLGCAATYHGLPRATAEDPSRCR